MYNSTIPNIFISDNYYGNPILTLNPNFKNPSTFPTLPLTTKNITWEFEYMFDDYTEFYENPEKFIYNHIQTIINYLQNDIHCNEEFTNNTLAAYQLLSQTITKQQIDEIIENIKYEIHKYD